MHALTEGSSCLTVGLLSVLCIKLTNTKHSWENGTRCRDGVSVLWCRSHLVWLVFEGSRTLTFSSHLMTAVTKHQQFAGLKITVNIAWQQSAGKWTLSVLCIKLTNTKHSWENGTRCRDGVSVLWCRSHLVWLVFEGSRTLTFSSHLMTAVTKHQQFAGLKITVNIAWQQSAGKWTLNG